MDINLPDGRVLRNVPEGTTKAQIIAKLKANGEDVSWAEEKVKKQSGAEVLAKETGPLESILVAAGHGTNRILNGLTQLYLRGDEKALSGLKTNVDEQNAQYEPLAKERPWSTGFGSALPALAVPGAGAGYTGAMVAGAIPELLSYGTTQERVSRGAVGAAGGAAGRALGGLVSSALKPAGVGVRASDDAMAAANRIGYKPLAGEATQNRALLNIENYLSRSPGSSGALQRLVGKNTEAVDRAALRSIGEVGSEATPQALKAAETNLGAEFQRLQGVTKPVLGNDFLNALINVDASNASRGAFRSPKIDSLIDKSIDLASQGRLSGKAYKEIHSALASDGTAAYRAGDSVVGDAYKTIRKALDEAAKGSLSKADQEAWDTVRSQWANWKTLTKGNVAEAGHVSAAKVAQQLRSKGTAFRTGDTSGPLSDIGVIGEAFKSVTNPNSGALNSTMMYGNPITGGPLTVANWTAEKIYTNPMIQKYLREGIIDIGKNGEIIMKETGVPIGIEAMKKLLGSQE